MNERATAASETVVEILTRDYVNYHLVFVAGGTLMVIATLVVSIASIRELVRLLRTKAAGRMAALVTFSVIGSVGLLTAVGMAILVLANLGNALSSATGLADSISIIASQTSSSPRTEIQEAGAAWLRSTDTTMPDTLRLAIEQRLSWQAPKAVISLIALIVAGVFSVLWWRTLVQQSRRADPTARVSSTTLAVGYLMTPTCLVLMVLSLVNAQASLAPIVLTLTMGRS